MSHKETLLLTGGSGLLALNWARVAAPKWAVHCVLHMRKVSVPDATCHSVDLLSDQFSSLLDSVRPDLVVHTAGLTSVEACEADPAGATRANVDTPSAVAVACAARNIRLVHISTDHLIAGTAPMAVETASTVPVNQYARTKAEAEEAVLATAPDALVLRTNFFGWGPSYRPSFSDRVLTALQSGEEIVLFDDVFFTPILMDILIEAAHGLCERGASGIVHAVGDERLSKHAFGLRVAEAFGLDPSPIRAGKLSEASSLTRRPLEMSLCNERARGILGHNLGSIAGQLARLRATQSDPRVRELQKL